MISQLDRETEVHVAGNIAGILSSNPENYSTDEQITLIQAMLILLRDNDYALPWKQKLKELKND